MSKLLTLFFLLLTTSLSFGQTEINVSGQITNIDGQSVPGVVVFISSFFSDSSFYFMDAISGDNGQYETQIPVTSGDEQGNVSIGVMNCNAGFEEVILPWDLNNLDLVQDFIYCDIGIFDSCFVFIVENISPNGVSTLEAISPGGGAEEFIWNTGDVGQSIVVDAAGTFCVTANFADSCVATSCYDYMIDTFPSCFAWVDVLQTDSASGNVGNWELVVTATGTAPFTYQWETGEVTPSITVFEQGIYCVTVVDADGCSTFACAEVFDFEFCEVFIACDPPGSFQAIAFGQPPFQYQWSTGDTTMALFPEEEGEYCVTVTDASGCETNTCAYFTPNPGLDSCFTFILLGSDSLFNPNDTSGIIPLTAITFGTGPFEYAWSTGETTETIYVSQLEDEYCVTVTSSDTCISSACTNIWNGFCSSWVEVNYTAAGAVLEVYSDPFSAPAAEYNWSNGEAGNSIMVTEPGQYCVNVVHENGCVSEACAIVEFGNADSCFVWVLSYPDSSGFLYFEAIAAGVAPFTYQWSNGSTEQSFSIDFEDPNLCVTVTDATGCVATACAWQWIDCYVWLDWEVNPGQNGATVTAIGEDPNLVVSYLWSTGDSTQTIEISEEGEYCVTVTYIGNCVAESCSFITFNDIDTVGFGIGGLVYGDSGVVLSGQVHAYSYEVTDANGSEVVLTFEASTDINGDNDYYFESLSPGLYLFQAITDPNADGEAEYFPTYHVDAVEWQSAVPVFVPNWEAVTTDIFLQSVPGGLGDGTISGTLLDPDQLIAQTPTEVRDGEGLANVEVILIRSDGTPFRFTYTDEDGNFLFDQLPWGTYKLIFDVPGLVSPETWVTIGPGDPNQEGVLLNAGVATSTEPLIPDGTVKIFPNPTSDFSEIEITEIEGEIQLTLTNLHGQMIWNRQVNVTRSQRERIELVDLPDGIYLLSLETIQGSRIYKVIKQ